MFSLKSTPSITGAVASTTATVYARKGSSVVERTLDKRGVAGSIPAPCTLGIGAVASTTATSFFCGSSSMVERRPSKSDVASSSLVSRSLGPLNRTAASSARRRVSVRGRNSGVECVAVNHVVGCSNHPAFANLERWHSSSDRSFKGSSGDAAGLQNQLGEFDSPTPCQRQQ